MTSSIPSIARRSTARAGFAGLLLAMCCAVASADAPDQRRPGPLLQCAAYDIHFRTLVDDLGETGEASDEALAVAGALAQEARRLCLRGAFAQAFKAFESIDLPPVSMMLLEDLLAHAPLTTDRRAER